MRKSSLIGTLLLFGTAFIWGFAFVAQRYGSNMLDGISFSGIRYCIATAALGIMVGIDELVAKLKGKKSIPFNKNTIIYGIICGTALMVATLSQQIGLGTTEAGKGSFISALYIVFVPFLGVIVGRKTSIANRFAILIAVVGFWLMCITDNFGIEQGDILILGCAVVFSFQIIFIDMYASNCDSLKFNFMQFATSAVLSIPFMAINGFPTAQSIGDCIMPLLYMGILSSGVAYTLQVAGQKRVAPSISTLIMSLESVFGLLCGAIFLKEDNSPKELLGCLLVFIAVFIAQFEIPKTFLEFDKK